MDGKNKKIETAYKEFEEAAIKHAEATEAGNYKQANKSYHVIARTACFLKETKSIEILSKLFDNKSIGARMWAATYLLPVCECQAIQILQTIANEDNIHSLTAKTTIDEWAKGNLVL